MYKKSKFVKRNLIINNEIVLTDIPHPDEGINDKKWIADIFIKEFIDSEIIENKNNVFKIRINKKIYNFYFDTTDSGGTKNKRKVEIPFNIKGFRNKIIKKESIYVVNLYRPLLNLKNVDDKKRVWLVIDPDEIYNSTSYINKTFNGSSRWISLDEIFNVIQNSSNFLLNNKKNVIASFNNLIQDVFENEKLIAKYHLMTNFKNYLNSVNDEIQKRKYISKIRQNFRKVLITEGNNQINSVVKNNSLLVASHIRSVEDIVNDSLLTFDEKLFQISDINNGIFIPVGLDKLFDKNFVTFDDNWNILISKEVSIDEVVELTGRDIFGKWIKNKNEKSFPYLEKHREKSFNIRKY